MYYVYCLENVESDKKYFGYTNLNPVKLSFDTLFKFASSSQDLVHLYNSMKKYGEEVFCMSISGMYSKEENALNYMKRLIQINETYCSSKGYNYKDVQLIPCCNETVKQCTEAIFEAPQEPYSFFDIIISCTKCLSDMNDCFEKREFTDFMIAYDEYNKYIPMTGILNNFCLSQSAIMFQLLRVCKDALSVYIKEYEIIK